MNVLKQALGHITGGMVLDVATGRGGSIGVLQRNIKSHSVVVGIDNSEANIKQAQKSHGNEDVLFIRMNAEDLALIDHCFDTVCIFNSLHHLVNIRQVLDEMKRVLKPGGKFVISETHRDGETESQLTTVYIHHWIAQIDTALGFVHNKTFTRRKIIDYASGLGLSDLVIHNRVIKDKDPFNEKTIRRYEKYLIEKYLQRAKEALDSQRLVEQGAELRKRLHAVGTQTQEPLVIIVGEK